MSGRILALKAETRVLGGGLRWRESLASEPHRALLIGAGETGALDPSALAATLTGSVDIPIVVEAAVGDHDPYNLARRILSLQRIHSARVSLLLTPGGIDPLTLTARELAGVGDEASQRSPAEIWSEFVRVIRALWGSLPLADLSADQDTGVFAEEGTVVPIAFSGDSYRVAGPLNAPLDDRGIPHIWARVSEDTQASLLDVFIDEADDLIGDLPRDARERVTERLRAGGSNAELLSSIDAFAAAPVRDTTAGSLVDDEPRADDRARVDREQEREPRR